MSLLEPILRPYRLHNEVHFFDWLVPHIAIYFCDTELRRPGQQLAPSAVGRTRQQCLSTTKIGIPEVNLKTHPNELEIACTPTILMSPRVVGPLSSQFHLALH